MRLIVYAGEVLEIKMSINLGGADVGVAQEFLYGTQVAAGFQQMTGERMAEQVRMDALLYALGDAPALEPRLYAAR